MRPAATLPTSGPLRLRRRQAGKPSMTRRLSISSFQILIFLRRGGCLRTFDANAVCGILTPAFFPPPRSSLTPLWELRGGGKNAIPFAATASLANSVRLIRMFSGNSAPRHVANWRLLERPRGNSIPRDNLLSVSDPPGAEAQQTVFARKRFVEAWTGTINLTCGLERPGAMAIARTSPQRDVAVIARVRSCPPLTYQCH